MPAATYNKHPEHTTLFHFDCNGLTAYLAIDAYLVGLGERGLSFVSATPDKIIEVEAIVDTEHAVLFFQRLLEWNEGGDRRFVFNCQFAYHY